MSLDLYNINSKAFSGEPLVHDEIDFAIQLMNSPVSEDAIMASGIILLSGSSEEKLRACEQLRIFCNSKKYRDTEKAAAFLITALEYLPEQELQDHACFRNFAYLAAKSGFVPTRVNAMRVLRRLGRMGYKKAATILRQAVDDPNFAVQKGAETALRFIKK